MRQLEARNNLTLLLDGWEDVLKRSLYGSVAAKVNQCPVVLTINTLLSVTDKALDQMQVNPRKFIACTKDNPTTMHTFCVRLKQKYWWLLTFACFLHGLNTTIGEISSYPLMKKVILQAIQVVTFFSLSHYWGSQLKEEAKKQGIKTSLKQNCESRWYALVRHCMSMQTYRSFWSHLDQFIETTKPLVDAIGNLESRQTTLADCMLELIRCARTMTCLSFDKDDEDVGFWMHAKSVFNRRFHEMDTDRHSLALFLHPLCRQLAVLQVANGHSFEMMTKTALTIAKQWQWSKSHADALVSDLKLYYQRKAAFVGSQRDALDWWESLPISSKKHPLKSLAIVLHSIVPHAGDIERLFSDLGGTQSAKRCRLSVPMFEKLGKLRANYSYHLHKLPPLTLVRGDADADSIEGPESLTVDDLARAFDDFKRDLWNSRAAAVAEGEEGLLDGGEVLEGNMYNFKELEKVDQGVAPTAFEDDIRVLDTNPVAADADWDMDAVLASAGIIS
ncbi:hypothetical protein OH77DRAFT_1507314 [Trametes cingulata]|nr:hypothetical protein OH77DRAFT_1507314 [Trametes cingulata]